MGKVIIKKAPKTIAKLKKDLRLVLHKYIRLRDCGGSDFGTCISCGKTYPARDLDAGHFLPSTYQSVRFEEKNIWAQCQSCNRFKHGNLVEYRANLIQKIGREAVEALEARRHDTFKQTREWYEEKIQYYKQKLESLTK